jgi:hypothetical protein
MRCWYLEGERGIRFSQHGKQKVLNSRFLIADI